MYNHERCFTSGTNEDFSEIILKTENYRDKMC
jgi:hypothetical protein